MSGRAHGSARWVPEIVYEEGGSKIPYIHVPNDEEDPGMLFIFLSRETGETEPGDDGDEVPIVEMNLHQYADMDTLKRKLSHDVFDQVRGALGLLPLREAVEKGRSLTQNVREEVEHRTDKDRRREEIQTSVAEGLDRRSKERGEA
jgi:hypothetical protein